MTPLSVNIITDVSLSKNKNLIIEIISNDRISSLSRYGFSDLQIQKITENFSLNTEKKAKKIIFSHISPVFDTIICFFPSDSLMDDRSELFSGLTKHSIFLPEWDEWDAFESMVLSTYKYETYLSEPKNYTHDIVISSENIDSLDIRKKLVQSIFLARDLINMPPQDANPIGIVNIIKSHTWKHFTVEIFDKSELQKLGCNLLLAVGAGSDFGPYMVVLRPKNPPKTEKYGLIWKGVTFDAGGIQIKPDTAMLDMKCDMSGAAGMIGTAMYLDTFDTLPVDLTIAVALTENMTGGSAFKPLDIYKAYNGTTVEIHHTDAEWRLVLADVMSYVEKNYKVDHLITMATLTGACLYALGYDIAGIMGDDEMVISTLIDNKSPYEKLWRLPLNEKMKKALKADIADLKNITRTEKAGSSIGWAFLSYFQWNAKLTHLDIAGPAYRESTFGYMPKWATGWWVKILSEFLLWLKK
jgi:leucyl aminopeptidase